MRMMVENSNTDFNLFCLLALARHTLIIELKKKIPEILRKMPKFVAHIKVLGKLGIIR